MKYLSHAFVFIEFDNRLRVLASFYSLPESS